jgi:hypothetical protein
MNKWSGSNIVWVMNSLLSREGGYAYDASIEQDVLVVAVQLAHLGDSPMHAEITNTNNPGTSLHPCRGCNLGVQSKALKQNENYICSFVGINSEGVMVCDSCPQNAVIWKH